MAEQNGWNALTGHSNAQSAPWTERPEYDKDRYQYGGYTGGAALESSNLTNRQARVEERAAPQMQGAQMQGTQLDQGAANQTRDIQMGSLASLQGAANGTAPSAAENLARQGIDRSLRAQTSAAGNVRGGPGATASAYRSAAQGAAAQRADMNQGIQAERANEIAGARGQLASASLGVRGQDLGAATTNAQLGQDTNKTNAQLLQDTNKTNAGMQLQSTALNDQRAAQYEQLRNKVNEDQLNANLTQQQIAAGQRQNIDQLNTQTNQFNAKQNQSLFNGAVGLGQGIIGGATKAIFSDPNSKMPIMGSLAELGLGGRKTAHGVGGGTELDQSGGISHDTLNEAGSGLASPQPVQGMVGGGGITGGYVPTGEDGSGAGMMTSDEKAKEAPQTYGVDEDRSSPSFRGWLGRATKGAPEKDVAPNGGAMTSGPSKVKSREALVDELVGDAKYATPYERDPEVAKGVAGAPRGYANGREAPEEDNVSWSKPDTWGSSQPGKKTPDTTGQAPGTDDYEKTGGDAAKNSETDWNNGGAAMKPEGRPGVAEAILGGIAGARPFGAPPPAQRDIATSDEEAKTPSKNPDAAKKTQDVAKKVSRAADVVSVISPTASLPISALARGFGHAADTLRNDEVMSTRKALDEEQSVDDERAALNRDERNRAAPTGTSTAHMQPKSTLEEAYNRLISMSDEHTKEGFQHVGDHDMADAMRSMDPAIYAYKGKYTPPDQTPGEVNVGPMANKMAADPVARTAIVRDPSSGMLAIDKTKAEKVIMGSLASLQHQIDELDDDVPRAVRAKKRRSDAAYA